MTTKENRDLSKSARRIKEAKVRNLLDLGNFRFAPEDVFVDANRAVMVMKYDVEDATSDIYAEAIMGTGGEDFIIVSAPKRIMQHRYNFQKYRAPKETKGFIVKVISCEYCEGETFEDTFVTEEQVASALKSGRQVQISFTMFGYATRLTAEGNLSIGCATKTLDEWVSEGEEAINDNDLSSDFAPFDKLRDTLVPLLKKRLAEMQPKKKAVAKKKAKKRATTRR